MDIKITHFKLFFVVVKTPDCRKNPIQLEISTMREKFFRRIHYYKPQSFRTSFGSDSLKNMYQTHPNRYQKSFHVNQLNRSLLRTIAYIELTFSTRVLAKNVTNHYAFMDLVRRTSSWSNRGKTKLFARRWNDYRTERLVPSTKHTAQLLVNVIILQFLLAKNFKILQKEKFLAIRTCVS